MNEKQIAILASGSGTNAENIAKYFSTSEKVEVTLIGSNKSEAKVLNRANRLGIPSFTFTKDEMEETGLVDQLDPSKFDLIVLAGFLLKIPEALLSAFPDRVINIHPSLLPKYGGKGMYGDRVHQAVLEAGEKQSGITIHLVNEVYDDGRILRQATCEVMSDDTPDSLASRIHKLEYEYFPKIIEEYLNEI